MGAIIENIDPASERLTKNRLLDRSTLQMWIGSQSVGTGWLDGEMVKVSPAANENERRLILQFWEPAYFDLCNERMKQVYLDSPADFWIRTVKRVYFVFMSDPTKAYLPLPMMKDVRWGKCMWIGWHYTE